MKAVHRLSKFRGNDTNEYRFIPLPQTTKYTNTIPFYSVNCSILSRMICVILLTISFNNEPLCQ